MYLTAPGRKIYISFIRTTTGKEKMIKRRPLVLAVLIAILSMPTAYIVQAAGYDLVPGLDYCLQNFGAGGRGCHYINHNLVDTTIDMLHPEAMIYAPDANGSIQLGAVEYIVPAWMRHLADVGDDVTNVMHAS